MVENTIEELRYAIKGTEEYLKEEYDRRIGRDAAIVYDITTNYADNTDMVISVLAHAFVYAATPDGECPDLSRCIERFVSSVQNTIDDVRNGRPNATAYEFSEIQDCILQDYEKNGECDHYRFMESDGPDQIYDDILLADDPEQAIVDHLDHLFDFELIDQIGIVESMVKAMNITYRDTIDTVDPDIVAHILKAIDVHHDPDDDDEEEEEEIIDHVSDVSAVVPLLPTNNSGDSLPDLVRKLCDGTGYIPCFESDGCGVKITLVPRDGADAA